MHPCLLRAGEMNDAAEVLRMLYDALIQQGHRDMVTACFGLDIHESVRCRHCDMETHALRYTQYFQVRNSTCITFHHCPHLPYGAAMCRMALLHSGQLFSTICIDIT